MRQFCFSRCDSNAHKHSGISNSNAHKHSGSTHINANINANIQRISESRLGTVQRLLVEGRSKRDADELMGRTECNRVVNFVAPERLIGQMVDVKITDTRTYTLRGEVVTQG